jgi:Ca-activated chloride channel family protein
MISGRHVLWTATIAFSAALGLALLLPSLLRLGAPGALGALAIPAAFVTCFAAYRWWRSWTLQRLGNPATLSALARHYDTRRANARVGIAVAAMGFACVALARPQWGEEPREVRRKGIDVVIALDISRSMLATDVTPSRLDAATDEVERILRRLDGDRVGLVVFAGIAFVQSPLTSDYGAIRLYLDRLDPEELPIQGTASGRAIHEATRLLRGTEGDTRFQRASNQVIVLISDGEDHDGDPIAAAEAARADGIDVFTVGVGTPEGGRIPIRDANGQILRYFTDRNDEVVVTKLEEAQLMEVASRGGGEYLPLRAGGAVAQALDEAIASYDAEALATMSRVEYEERFAVFLWPALVLLILATAIRDPRAVALLLVLAPLSGCGDQLLRPDPRVAAALALVDAGTPQAAIDALERVGAEARAVPTYPYAAGWIHEQAAADNPDAWSEAQANYVRALNMTGEEEQIAATFAIGNALMGREELDAAIARYERTLALDPGHDGARRNLEIALRRRFPPCALALDDAFEEDSDAAATAPLLPAASFTGEFLPPGIEATPGESEEPPELVICGGDPDWYAIPVLGGATVDVQATFTRLRDDNGGPPLPSTIPPTAVRLTLYDFDGATVLAIDQGLAEGDASPVDARRLERKIAGAAIHPGVETGTSVYLQVDVDAPLEYEVALTIEVTPPCYALEDSFESNDLQQTAFELDSGTHQARLCESNDDWYRVSLAPEDDLFFDIRPPINDDGTVGQAAISVQSNGESRNGVEVFQTGELASYALRAPQAGDAAFVSLVSEGGTEGPYELGVFHYPPCPEGGDRFEPNDDPNQRAELALEEAPFRFLRLCPGDLDWFTLALPPPTEEQQEESAQRPFSALAELLPPPVPPADEEPPSDPSDPADEADAPAPMADPRVELVVYDLASSALLAQSTPIALATPEAREGVDGDRGAVAFANLPWETQQVVVGVRGDPTYYHLSFPQTQQQQQEQSESQEGEGDPEEDAQQEPSEDDAQPEDADEAPEPEAQEPAEPEEADEQEAEAPEPTPEEQAEAEREALMELLDSLEPMDDNLPLRQALENMPPTEMRQPW